jgi:hypothetical protein
MQRRASPTEGDSLGLMANRARPSCAPDDGLRLLSSNLFATSEVGDISAPDKAAVTREGREGGA